jgi:hypothetical protein
MPPAATAGTRTPQAEFVTMARSVHQIVDMDHGKSADPFYFLYMITIMPATYLAAIVMAGAGKGQ